MDAALLQQPVPFYDLWDCNDVDPDGCSFFSETFAPPDISSQEFDELIADVICGGFDMVPFVVAAHPENSPFCTPLSTESKRTLTTLLSALMSGDALRITTALRATVAEPAAWTAIRLAGYLIDTGFLPRSSSVSNSADPSL